MDTFEIPFPGGLNGEAWGWRAQRAEDAASCNETLPGLGIKGPNKSHRAAVPSLIIDSRPRGNAASCLPRGLPGSHRRRGLPRSGRSTGASRKLPSHVVAHPPLKAPGSASSGCHTRETIPAATLPYHQLPSSLEGCIPRPGSRWVILLPAHDA